MNKTALITGASSGIGEQFARIHAKQGGNLVIVAQTASSLEALKSELEDQYGVQVTVIVIDLAKSDSANTVYQIIKAKNLQIDYLINNAGVGGQGYFHERALEEELAMIQLNVVTLTQLTHLVAKDMIANKCGKILNVSSSAALVPGGPLQTVYYATKAYVLSFSQALACELEEYGITVTALCPGATKTQFSETAGLSRTKLFSSLKLTPDKVAKEGYQAMLQGKLLQISVSSWFERMKLMFVPLMPKRCLLRYIKSLQKVAH